MSCTTMLDEAIGETECMSAETKRVFSRALASTIDLSAGSSDESRNVFKRTSQMPVAAPSIVSALEKALLPRRDAGHRLIDMVVRGAFVVEMATSLAAMTRTPELEEQFVSSYANPAVIVLAADYAMRAMTSIQTMQSALNSATDEDRRVNAHVRAFDHVGAAIDDLSAAVIVGLELVPADRKRGDTIKQTTRRSQAGVADVAQRLRRDVTSVSRRARDVFVNALRVLKFILAAIAEQHFLVIGAIVVSPIVVLEAAFLLSKSKELVPEAVSFFNGFSDGIVGGLMRLPSLVTTPMLALPAPPPTTYRGKLALMFEQMTLQNAMTGTLNQYVRVREPFLSAIGYALGAVAGTLSNLIPTSIASLQSWVILYLAFKFVYQPISAAVEQKKANEAQVQQNRLRAKQNAENQIVLAQEQARIIGNAVAQAMNRQLALGNGPRVQRVEN